MPFLNGEPSSVSFFPYQLFILVLFLGPTNSAVAREKAPESLRAKFGTDATKNACHGSASPAEAKNEIEFWFPGFFAEAH